MLSPRISVLLVVLSGVLFGTAGTAQALGPDATTPIGVGILRIQVGGLAMLAVAPFLGLSLRRLPSLWRRPAIVVAAVCAASYQPVFFAGVSQVGVALGTLVAVGSEPAFAGLLGWIFLRHRPTLGWFLATSVCVAGLVLRSLPGLSGELGPDAWLGLLMALTAGFASAGYNTAAKKELDRGTTVVELSTGAFALGGLGLIPLLVREPLGWVAAPSGVGLVLYLGIATMALANALLTRGLHGLKPGPVATLMLMDPVVATILGVVVLGETLDGQAALGVLLVCAGLLAQGLLAARETPNDEEPVPIL